MNIEGLKNKLMAKLSLSDANAAVKEAKAALNDPRLSGGNSKAEKVWQDALAGSPPPFMSCSDAKAVLTHAAAEYNELLAGKLPTAPQAAAPTAEPKAAAAPPAPSAKSAPAASPRTAESFSKVAASLPRPSAVITPKASAVPAQFATKPDFSALKGVERVSASMRWNNDRKAHFIAEATKQIDAEAAAALPPSPFAGLPATAENLAKSLLHEQAEAAKPKVSAWSQEGSNRSKAIKTRAAELESQIS